MSHILVSYPSTTVKCGGFSGGMPPWERRQSRVVGVVKCCSCSSTEEVDVFGKVENESKRSKSGSREIKEIDDNNSNKENGRSDFWASLQTKNPWDLGT
ncbi:hypothetical protein Dsin_001960 [Dipteronia sinensis]|uniref:Uncharacterized protein n=1 Tax=Dipteronia sinensis TaxID=43782 RepID=A0AAE0EJ84_9ROSI|nr:hypothetical protein Dsin_001960 [Dipteronia sinensis]